MLTCVICNNKLIPKASARPENDWREEEAPVVANHFFTLLERYLGSDYFGGVDEKEGEEEAVRFLLKKVISTGFRFCGECYKITESFCELYQELKSIELLINWKVMLLKDILTAGMETPIQKKDNLKKANLAVIGGGRIDLIIGFKHNLIKKCEQKLKTSFPRLKLNKCKTPKPEECEWSAISLTKSISLMLSPPQISDLHDYPCLEESMRDEEKDEAHHEDLDTYSPPQIKRSLSSDSIDSALETQDGTGTPPVILPTTLSFKDKDNGSLHIPPPIITQSSTKSPPATNAINTTTGMLQCNLCPKEFKIRYLFLQHYKTSHLKVRYGCGLCHKVFIVLNNYQEHYQAVHAGLGHKCSKCGKIFTLLGSYSRHLKRTTCGVREEEVVDDKKPKTSFPRGKLAKCKPKSDGDECSETSQTNSTSSIAPTPKLNDLPIFPCLDILKTDADQIHHHEELPSPTQSYLSSDVVDSFLLETNDATEAPSLNPSATPAPPYETHIEAGTSSVQVVKERSDEDEDSNSLYIPPPIITQSSTTPPPATNAINPATGKLICNLCPKEFPSRNHFLQHYKIAHLKIRSQCGICQKDFSVLNTYREHYKAVHAGVRHKCPKCGKIFTHSFTYRYHLKVTPCGMGEESNANAYPKRRKHKGKAHALTRSLKYSKHERKSWKIIKVRVNDDSTTSIPQPKPIIDPTETSPEGANNASPQSAQERYCKADDSISLHVPPPVVTQSSTKPPPATSNTINPTTGMLLCNLCPKEFPSRYHFLQHYKISHLKVRHMCGPCQKEFSVLSNYRAHYKIVHAGVRHKCPKCGKIFTQLAKCKDHLKATLCGVEKDEIAKCKICQKSFTSHYVLKIHIRRFHDPSRRKSRNGVDDDKPDSPQPMLISAPDPVMGRHKCNLCKKEFLSASGYYSHRLDVHVGVRFKCHVCSKTFSRRHALKLHQLRKHPVLVEKLPLKKGIKRHVCDHCGKSFYGQFNLKIHLKTVHLKVKEHVCDQCGWKFGLLENLRKHIKIVHQKTRNHVCDTCGKGFGRRNDLQMHLRAVHLKLREHICDICGKTFTNPNSLRGHVKSLHQLCRYECDICKKKFTGKRRMIIHRSRQHPEENRVGQ